MGSAELLDVAPLEARQDDLHLLLNTELAVGVLVRHVLLSFVGAVGFGLRITESHVSTPGRGADHVALRAPHY